MKSWTRFSTNTRLSTNTPRPTSDTIIMILRLKRSARTPPTATKNSPGRSRATSGTRMAVSAWAPPSRAANVRVANSATQSPMLENSPAHHSRANGPCEIS